MTPPAVVFGCGGPSSRPGPAPHVGLGAAVPRPGPAPGSTGLVRAWGTPRYRGPAASVACLWPTPISSAGAGCHSLFHQHQRLAVSPHATAHTTTDTTSWVGAGPGGRGWRGGWGDRVCVGFRRESRPGGPVTRAGF